MLSVRSAWGPICSAKNRVWPYFALCIKRWGKEKTGGAALTDVECFMFRPSDLVRPILLHGLVEVFIQCDAEMKEHLINSIEEASPTSPTSNTRLSPSQVRWVLLPHVYHGSSGSGERFMNSSWQSTRKGQCLISPIIWERFYTSEANWNSWLNWDLWIPQGLHRVPCLDGCTDTLVPLCCHGSAKESDTNITNISAWDLAGDQAHSGNWAGSPASRAIWVTSWFKHRMQSQIKTCNATIPWKQDF